MNRRDKCTNVAIYLVNTDRGTSYTKSLVHCTNFTCSFQIKQLIRGRYIRNHINLYNETILTEEVKNTRNSLAISYVKLKSTKYLKFYAIT